MSAFVPLRVQSCYSMLESTLEPKAIAKLARAKGFPAVGVADRANLFAAMELGAACMAAGVQPVVGVLLPVCRPVAEGPVRPGARAAIDHVVLFAQDEVGWRNMLALVSDAHVNPAAHEGCVPLDRLDAHAEGLICLTGGADGAVTKLLAEGQADAAAAYFDRLHAAFGDRLFAELARVGDPVCDAAESQLIALADARAVPLVAADPVRFAEAQDHEAHDVMGCVRDGDYLQTQGRAGSNPEWWFIDRATAEARWADLPDALANTEVVARRCAFAPPKRKPILPRLLPDVAAEDAQLMADSRAGLAARLRGEVPAAYAERLDFELDVIARMGFSGYFLIVADFIGWAKRMNIPVGPGRGSGAGSVVAWALLITDLDPLEHDLLFERFLNPERVSMPDFDIDFCETRRGEVIEYVRDRYGADRVAAIVTFGKLKARAVLKDVGRVLQLPYGQLDRLSKLVPNVPTDPWTLQRTLDNVPELRSEMKADPKVARLVKLALKLEGLPRHSSTHAAGVVIGDRPLAELVPLYADPRVSLPISQFDLKWVEAAGLVKFDFLGLKTLSVLQRGWELAAPHATLPAPLELPTACGETFAMMTRGETVGVFQFESEGMRRALALVRPTTFGDIVALGALYRPGPMDNIPSFAARKWGREKPDYLHPSLEAVLKPTYGVIIYQEQVMSIAKELAGYSLGEADLLRRAMGKKIKAEMDAQRARFVDGAAERGVDREQAAGIFDLVEKFAGYGFNRSHAAAYALLSWQTAWLKRHHPAAFYAASMQFDMDFTDKLAVLMDDARRLGVTVLPPCINASAAGFTVERAGEHLAVRYALGALKGVGEGAMAALVDERGRGGPFRDLGDLVARIDPRALNRRQLEALAGAGALDALEPDRARVFAAAEGLLAAASAAHEARSVGQGGLFGEAAGGAPEAFPLPVAESWGASARLAAERAAFGFYFSGHPVDAHAGVLRAKKAISWADACAMPAPAGGGKRNVVMAGLVEATRWRTPNGAGPDRRYLLLDLTDSSGAWGASAFDAEAQEAVLAADGRPVLLQVELAWRPGEDTPRAAVRGAVPLEALARSTRVRLVVELRDVSAAVRLAELLPRGGRSLVDVVVETAAGPATFRLGADFAVDPVAVEAVERLAGVSAVNVDSAELRLAA